MNKKNISHYKILEKIGEGGMGVVYKAEDTKLRRTVALKFLPAELTRDEEAKERFVQEAQAAAAIDHPNICIIYEINESEGKTFISMAYIKGQSLKEKIASGPVELEEVLDIAIHTAEGLKEAHENGIVHRDIKPANIMLTKKGQVKIMDFGLADAYATFGFYHWWPFEEARSKSKEFALKGLEVDDTVGETHGAYASYLAWSEYRWAEAENEFEKAIELSPSDVEARHMYAHLLECSGRFDEAIAEMGMALELEPLSIILNHCMGNILFFSGDNKGAIDMFQKTIEMDPSFSIQYFWLGRVYLHIEELQKAIEIFEKGTKFPAVNAIVSGGLGLAYALAGRDEDAKKILDQLEKLSKEKYVDAYPFAYIYMGLRDKDKAFEYLEKCFEVGDMYLLYLPIDPIFKELHDDPRFEALLKKMGL